MLFIKCLDFLKKITFVDFQLVIPPYRITSGQDLWIPLWLKSHFEKKKKKIFVISKTTFC